MKVVGAGDGQGEKSQREVKMVVMSASSVPMVFPAVLMILWMVSCSAFVQLEDQEATQYVSTLSIAEIDQQSFLSLVS